MTIILLIWWSLAAGKPVVPSRWQATEPDHFLYEGSPGVVIDVGPAPADISVDLDFGPCFSTSSLELTLIEPHEFRKRAERVNRGLHPLRDEPIAPFDPFGPGPHNMTAAT